MEVSQVVNGLKKAFPEAIFREQPEASIKAISKLEDKYHLNTDDFINKRYSFEIDEEDVFDWLNEYENLILHGGNPEMLNSIKL